MKYAIIMISFFLFQLTSINAQETDSLIIENPVKLSIEKHSLADLNQEVFVLWVSGANPNDVTKAWGKTMESGNKAKLESEGNKHQIIGAILKDIDKNNSMNVYADIIQERKGVKVFAAFQLNDSTWIDPDSDDDKTVKTENLLTGFGEKVYIEVLNNKLSVENGQLKSLEKENNSNLKSQTNEKKSIQSDSLSIFNTRNEIKLKKGEYTTTTDKLSKQRNYIASTNFTSDEEKKEANKLMKNIEKELKKITKEIEKLQNNIVDMEKNIKESYYKIDQLKVEETELMDKITEQKSRIKRLEHEIYELENKR